jgi:aminomethyltransferase
MVLYPEPVAEVSALLKQTGCEAFLHYDMAHVLGLLGPHFQEPFKQGADLVTGSTHKTFFGPQRGVAAGDFEPGTPGFELWEAIENRSFPGMVSNHHLGTLVGLLAAALEMNAFKDAYQPQVLANAKALAASLAQNQVKVCGDPEKGYTQTHQVVVDVGYGRGMKTAYLLEKNNIITNYQALPWDEGFTASSGLRLGVAEMTRFGMKEGDFKHLGELMAQVVIKNQDVTAEVAELRREFQELGYCFQGKEIEGFSQDLLSSI